jgi:hypothetical protein
VDARGKLKVRGACYWRAIERGAHLGYRKLKRKPGTWWGRFYAGQQEYVVETLGIADDLSDADGVEGWTTGSLLRTFANAGSNAPTKARESRDLTP